MHIYLAISIFEFILVVLVCYFYIRVIVLCFSAELVLKPEFRELKLNIFEFDLGNSIDLGNLGDCFYIYHCDTVVFTIPLCHVLRHSNSGLLRSN